MDTPLKPLDAPLLAPYAETQPGFEVLIGPVNEFTADERNRCLVSLWSIWPKCDPPEIDPVRQRIDAMQEALGDLDDETRYIRLQITCLQRCYYGFPRTIDSILLGIGSGTAQLDMSLSCEPPWQELRGILRHLRGISDEHPDERQVLAYVYLTILTAWIGGAEIAWVQNMLPDQAALAESSYRLLGQPDMRKTLQGQRLCTSLMQWAFPTSEDWEARSQRLSGLLEAQSAPANTTGEEDQLGQLIASNNDRGPCHHSFFRHLDYQIAMIGAGGTVALPDKGEERRRIQDAVTNYVHALGSWLAHRTEEEAIRIWPPAGETIRKVYGIFGDESPAKRWLAASLWKRLQDNQAHHGRGALDMEPERFALPEGTLDI